MTEQFRAVTPKSPIGKALEYSLRRWKSWPSSPLTGGPEIDDNRIENEIRAHQSVDFFTHGSQYALYMVQDKETGTSSDTSADMPVGNVQENNLYASETAKAFQSWGGGQQTSTINSIDFNKFTNDAKIEIHGCKSAAGTWLIDNLGINLSEALYKAGKTRAVVIAQRG